MYEIPLNKFEKSDLVIKLHKEGKTYREIAHIAHVLPRDIKSILKEYERKKNLEAKTEENNTVNQKTTKKLSLSSQAFKLFKENKKPIDVAIELDIPFVKAKKFWAEFLNLERMSECYDLYTEHSYEIPTLLSIATFMKRNNISGSNVVNTLRTANDINNLNQTHHNLKMENKDLEQRRMYLLYSPRSPYYSLQPLPLNKPNYNYHHY
jgi:hypothetical protein